MTIHALCAAVVLTQGIGLLGESKSLSFKEILVFRLLQKNPKKQKTRKMLFDSNSKHCGYRQGTVGRVGYMSLRDMEPPIYQKNHLHIRDTLFALTG